MEQPKTDHPESSKTISTIITQEIHTDQENDDRSVNSNEICTQSLELHSAETPNEDMLLTGLNIEDDPLYNIETSAVPLILISRLPVTSQSLHISSNLPSAASMNMVSSNQPQSLFLQALSKLNESSLNLALTDTTMNIPRLALNLTSNDIDSPEITPPGSLTSAPPSYSFVLRQMAVRRRPRLMGTFIPSPSFVQHTPPPNYTTAFDIYVDNPLPSPPTRVYNFGFTPIPIVCPECGYTGMTIVASKITLCTHLCAVILCLLCCWICAPLPYVLRSCKDVYHYCRNCRNFLGMYCPTNPESAYA